MDLKAFLYEKCMRTISNWEETDIYLVSFLVYANEECTYKGISNFPQFCIGYNTEREAAIAEKDGEGRWNYAFWLQNELPVVHPENAVSAELLLNWFRSHGIDNVGEVQEDDEYDSQMNYIGKGPVGYYEFLMIVADVAKKLQENGIIRDKFGNIPILVHDLEYCWYVEEATKIANPHGEADAFLAYHRSR